MHSLPITGELTDIPRNLMTDLRVREEWFGDSRIREWMDKARLNPTAGAASVEPGDAEKQAVLGRLLATMGPARSNLERIAAAAPSPSGGSGPKPISTGSQDSAFVAT